MEHQNDVRLLRAAQGKPCPYCGHTMSSSGAPNDILRPSRDHLIPRSQGTHFENGFNRIVVCAACNEAKGNFTLRLWLARLLIDGDGGRASRVAAIIAALYRERTREEADRLTGVACVSPTEALAPILPANPPISSRTSRLRNCAFPRCSCVDSCGNLGVG